MPGSKPTHCADHKSEEMEDVVSRKCEYCSKHPYFGFPGSNPTQCGDHRLEGMEDVVNRKCECCAKRPCFGFPGSKATRCGDHRLDEMIDINHSQCECCDSRPLFGFPGSEKATRCSNHKLPGMIDVVNPKCLTPLCGTRVCTKKYRGYCLWCFINQFPDEKVSRNYKTKEKEVVDFIKQFFPTVDWIHDRKIQGGSSLRRPDIFFDMGTYTIVIEIDENQHVSYDCTCTNRRLMELFQDGGSRPMIMVRFNPDAYTREDGSKNASCWTTNKKGLHVVKKACANEWSDRLEMLRRTIQMALDQGPVREVDVVHLYYDMNL